MEKIKLVVATGNTHKLKEIAEIFTRFEVISQKQAGFAGDVEETGKTFLENALIKARAASFALGCIALADDSGLCVNALDGAPGVYSARYAGEEANDAVNNQKLLTEMKDVPDADRGAAFVSVVACVFPEGYDVTVPEEWRVTKDGRDGFTVRGECRGTILREGRGCDGFGYDPLFYVSEKGCTFAELSSEEKNAISHRGVAMRAFCRQFLSLFEN